MTTLVSWEDFVRTTARTLRSRKLPLTYQVAALSLLRMLKEAVTRGGPIVNPRSTGYVGALKGRDIRRLQEKFPRVDIPTILDLFLEGKNFEDGLPRLVACYRLDDSEDLFPEEYPVLKCQLGLPAPVLPSIDDETIEEWEYWRAKARERAIELTP